MMTTIALTKTTVSDYFKLQETKISQPACYTYASSARHCTQASIFGLAFNVFVTFYGHGVTPAQKRLPICLYALFTAVTVCDPEIFQLAARRRRKVIRGVWKIPELETKSRLDGPLQLPPSWLVPPVTSHFFFFYVNQTWSDRAGQADFGRVRWSNSHCVCWL